MASSSPKVDELSFHGIRSDIRGMGARIGGLEGRVTGVENRCNSIADDVSELKTAVAVVGRDITTVLSNQEEERRIREHAKKVAITAEAEQGTELIKLEDTKVSSRSKILVGLFGIISAVLGAVGQWLA